MLLFSLFSGFVGEIGMLGSSICARALLPIEKESEKKQQTHRVKKKFKEFFFFRNSNKRKRQTRSITSFYFVSVLFSPLSLGTNVFVCAKINMKKMCKGKRNQKTKQKSEPIFERCDINLCVCV